MEDFRELIYKNYVSSCRSVRTHYGNKSEFSERIPYIHRRFGKVLQPFKDKKILELGCGPGYLLNYLEMQGFSNFLGIDISEEQVELAKLKGLPVREADALKYLDGLNNELDVVIAIDFIEHFSRDELIRLFQSVQKALKSGGLFLIQTPNGAGWLPGRIVWGDLTHMTIFTPDSLQQMLLLFDFYNVNFSETGPAPHGLLSFLRFVAWQVFRGALSLIKIIESGSRQRIWTKGMVCWAYLKSTTIG